MATLEAFIAEIVSAHAEPDLQTRLAAFWAMAQAAAKGRHNFDGIKILSDCGLSRADRIEIETRISTGWVGLGDVRAALDAAWAARSAQAEPTPPPTA